MPECPSGSTEPAPLRDLFAAQHSTIRNMAARFLRTERRAHTLRTTDLVSEVFLRMEREEDGMPVDHARLLAHAARACRRILVEHARRRAARGAARRVVLVESEVQEREREWRSVLDLDAALVELAQRHARAAHVVELRYFGGLTIEECAAELSVTTRTVDNDLCFAKAWLRRRLQGNADDAGDTGA